MTNWIKGSIPGSIFQSLTDSTEVKTFRELCQDPKSYIKAIAYFNESFGNISEKQLHSLNISKEIYVLLEFSFTNNATSPDFTFLNQCLSIYPSNKLIDEMMAQFMYQFLIESSENQILDSVPFFTKAISLIPWILLSNATLVDVWKSCFMIPKPNIIIGPLFINSADMYRVKRISSLTLFMSIVTDSIPSLPLECYPNSLRFIASMLLPFQCDAFFQNLFLEMTDKLPLVSDALFFTYFLVPPVKPPELPWMIFNKMCLDPRASPQLLESALNAIVTRCISSPNLIFFSFMPYVDRMTDLSPDTQSNLFTVLQALPVKQQIEFLDVSVPHWQFDVGLFADYAASVNWEPEYEHVINLIYLESGQPFFETPLISHVLPTMEIIPDLLKRFIAHDAIEPLLILLTLPIESIVQPIIDSMDKISPRAFSVFASVARLYPVFVDLFIKLGGLSPFVNNLWTNEAVDFLMALSCNGPHYAIDDIISTRFSDTILAQYDQNALKKVAFGSDVDGFLRITSLCQHLTNFDMSTPYDKYIFQTSAVRYVTPTYEQILTAAPVYFEDKKLLLDGKCLVALTNPDMAHFSLYQFHYMSPHCSGKYEASGGFSIWLKVDKVVGDTTICVTQGSEVHVDQNGLHIDGSTTHFTFGVWHMVSFIPGKGLRSSIAAFYLDGKLIHEAQGQIAGPVIFGSETKNNGIWYLGAVFTPTEEADLHSTFAKGCRVTGKPSVAMLPGLKFVQYHGILEYWDSIGGFAFVFNQMNFTKDQGEFAANLTAAFNLRAMGCISEDNFFNSLMYTLSLRDDFAPAVESAIVAEFNRGKPGYPLFARFLSDFYVLNIPFKFEFLPTIFEAGFDFSPLFGYLLDMFCFMELDPNVSKLFMSVIEFKMQPSFLHSIIMALISLPFLDSENTESLTDEIYYAKQKTLLAIVTKNASIFQEGVSFRDAFGYSYLMRNDLAIDFLEFVAKTSCETPSYFDIEVLKTATNLFKILAKDVRVIYVMLAFLFGKYATSIAGFESVDVARPQVMPYAFGLLADCFARTNRDPSLFPILDKLLCLIETGTSASGLSREVQRLCLLGYEGAYTTLPGDWDDLKPERGSPKAAKLSNLIVESRINHLDPQLSERTIEYLRRHQVSPESFDEVDRPLLEVDISLFDKDEVKHLINIATKLFILESTDVLSIKRLIVRYFVFPANIPNMLTLELHRRMTLSLLAHTLKEELVAIIIEFLAARVAEGWWTGHTAELFSAVMPLLSSKSKDARYLLFAIVQQSDAPVKVQIGTELAKSAIWNELDPNFIAALLHNFAAEEVKSQTGYDEFQQLTASFNADKAKFSELYQAVIKFALARQPGLRQLRTEITARPPPIKATRRERKVQAMYVRLAFKFQMADRLNRACIEKESIIIELFRQQYKPDPDHFQLLRSPHPLSIPIKMVPLCFHFTAPSIKTSIKLKIPHSYHTASFNTTVAELNASHTGPMLLDGWKLPTFLTCGLTYHFQTKYQGSSPFMLYLLNTPELMPCVVTYSKDKLHILVNAILASGEIRLQETSEMVCQFAAFENAIVGYNGETTLFCHHPVISITLSQVIIAIPRRWSYRDRSVDVYTTAGVQMTLVFMENDRRVFLSKLSKAQRIAAEAGPYLSLQLMSNSTNDVVAAWVDGRISTKDYLLYVNMKGGRSFNDLAQYPVFPWVAADYDNKSPSKWRDLTKPMGAQTVERQERFMTTYQETDPPYHYGTHYSTPAAVLHFMVRIEPFTLFAAHLHNGWDHKDRLFCDLGDAWRSASESNQADLKELIPEFFAFPPMSENPNHLALGTRTDGNSLESVNLPKWAPKGDLFVFLHRTMLEKAPIAGWIDLIFGSKQRGQAAIDAVNVYQPFSYDSTYMDYDETQMNAMLDAINNFGQCPSQVFLNSHPPQRAGIEVTTITSKLRITRLKTTEAVTHFRFLDDGLLCDHDRIFHIGPQGRAAEIAARYIVYDNKRFDLPAHPVAAAASADGGLLAVSTRHGVICTFAAFIGFVKISSSTLDFVPTVLAVSTQHYIVCAADSKTLATVDATSGLVMKSIQLDNVRHIGFDDVANFIVVATDTRIVVLWLDLRILVEAPLSSPVTALATGGRSLWLECPVFVTAQDTVNVWEIDIRTRMVAVVRTIDYAMGEITALSLLYQDGACVAASKDNCCAIATKEIMNRPVLRPNVYAGCASCGQNLKAGISCPCCGLGVCRNCVTKRKGVCIKCDTQFGSREEN